ncbi:DNA-binding response regulator [Cycloclasticus sp. 46_120_T64]|nr:DNA-binding response regulator [Cycloclasticus sp. 46_120_T64]
MKILIADDEPLARQRLKLLIEEISPEHDIYADASNGLEALQQCLQYQPDLALLDIRMPAMDGLQVAAEIQQAKLTTLVVFVTAFDQYAIQAFEQNAIDYLLKPVKKQRLQQSLDKVLSNTAQITNLVSLNQQLLGPRQYLCAQTHSGLQLLEIDDIIYFKADNKYTLAVTAETSVLLDQPLKQLAEEYPSMFFRIHRNALVNINSISAIVKCGLGRFKLRLNGCSDSLSISRRHQAELNRLLKQKQPATDKKPR